MVELTVVVESISRLARNTRDLLELVDRFKSKGVEFASLKETIDTHTGRTVHVDRIRSNGTT